VPGEGLWSVWPLCSRANMSKRRAPCRASPAGTLLTQPFEFRTIRPDLSRTENRVSGEQNLHCSKRTIIGVAPGPIACSSPKCEFWMFLYSAGISVSSAKCVAASVYVLRLANSSSRAHARPKPSTAHIRLLCQRTERCGKLTGEALTCAGGTTEFVDERERRVRCASYHVMHLFHFGLKRRTVVLDRIVRIHAREDAVRNAKLCELCRHCTNKKPTVRRQSGHSRNGSRSGRTGEYQNCRCEP
jgi:hypothetical protein